MFSFQGASEFLSSRDSMKHLLSQSCFSQSLFLVEISGIEPLTSCLQGRRSPSWAKPPSLCVLTRSLYQLKAQRSGFQLERRSRFAREHFAFRRNAEFAKRTSTSWWAKMDSNHRPHDYQSCALASWAIGPYWSLLLVQVHFPLYPLNWIT